MTTVTANPSTTTAAPVAATVTVPAEFFRGELRVYGNWREAFARELLQNAVDADPTRIDVQFEDVSVNGQDHGRVTFTDDGHGMTREVLEQVFFALGRTTKTGEGSIGGFGRARIIICFAQARYTIRTGTLLVEGEGGTYTITDTGQYRRGTQFTIDLIDASCAEVRDAFEFLLGACTLSVPVTLDGAPGPTRQMPPRAARVLKDEDGRAWARIYTSPGIGRMLVRVNGLSMFSQWLSTSDNVILELVPARSREVLAASRDQLVGQFRAQVDQFVADLAQNRRAALKAPAAPLDLRVGGGGFLASDADQLPEPGAAGDDDGRPHAEGGGTPVAVTAANTAALEHLAAQPVSDLLGQMDLLQHLDEETEPHRPGLGFDVYLFADANDARVRKLARAWDPTGWDDRSGTRRRALLLTWKAAVGYAMDTLLRTHPELGRVLWTVGWVFDQDVLGLHRSAGDGHVLALNPVADDGTTGYRISARADRQRLLSVALHEVTHVAVSGHDEQFAKVLTSLVGALDPIEADRVLRAAPARG